jgi:hypothetical protein
VLAVYTRPYDPRFPPVCLDETPTQLRGEVRDPLPCAPGIAARTDPEYVRGGVANLFLVCEPLRGWRHVTVTARRTGVDWAHCVREWVDLHDPDAEKIVLVLDQLNTHTPASLYEAFPPAEAKRIADRLEIHPTPKHGSGLNRAAIAFSVLVRQCLGQRLPDDDRLRQEVGAWEARRNDAATTIDWRFTTAAARIKLNQLYPVSSHDDRPCGKLSVSGH